MNNYWITKSVDRRFKRIQHFVDRRWSGLSTSRIDQKMIIGIKSQSDPQFQVTGNIPDAFKRAMKSKSKLEHICCIYLDGPDQWSLDFSIWSPIVNIMHWKSVDLPNRIDPAFLLQIEVFVDKSIAAWNEKKKEGE